MYGTVGHCHRAHSTPLHQQHEISHLAAPVHLITTTACNSLQLSARRSPAAVPPPTWLSMCSMLLLLPVVLSSLMATLVSLRRPMYTQP